MNQGTRLRGVVLLGLVALVVGAFPAGARLSSTSVRALRRAALAAPGLPGATDPVPPVEAWLRLDATLPAAELDVLLARLRLDPTLQGALLEVSAMRLVFRSAPRGRFVAWWNPDQKDSRGPATGLSEDDATMLGALLERTCAEQGIPAPEAVPYLVDLDLHATRVRGPDDLRWGIVTPSPRDRQAVVKLALLEMGDAPFVIDPLAALRGCEDPACRDALLDEARRTVVRSGYVPIVDALRASAFAATGDPAFASALLVVDHVDRLHPARTFGALLRTLSTARSPKERRRRFFEATGEAPARLDRLIQAELVEWARTALP